MMVPARRPDQLVRWLITLSALLLLMTGARAQGGSLRVNGVRVTAAGLWPSGTDRGYQPVEIELVNKTASPKEVRLLIRSNYGRNTSVEQVVRVEALEQRTLQMDVPSFDSEESRSWSSDYYLNAYSGGENEGIYGLCGQGTKPWSGISAMWFSRTPLAAGTQEVLASELSHGEGGQEENPRKKLLLRGALFEQMPTRARAYSGLNAVLIDAESGLPSGEALAAVLTYARLGGTLVMLGENAADTCASHELLQPLLESRFEQGANVRHSSGASSQRYSLGQGSLIIGWSSDGILEYEEESRALRSLLWDSRVLVPGPGARRIPSLAIPGIGEVPYGFFVAILILFAVLIGPLNFWFVRRSGKQVLLLLTIPAISLLASILLLSYGIFSQGLDTKVASVTLSMLDQRSGTLDVIENRHCFVGLGTGGGLRPMAGTDCYPVITQSESPGFSIRVGDETVMGGGFYASREEMRQIFLSERSSRLRFVVERSGAGFRVTNGLTCGVNDFLLRDAEGKAWGCEGRLAPGQTVELEAFDSNLRADNVEKEFTTRFGRESLGSLAALARGAYLAQLEDNLFQDDCGLELNELEGRHGLIGLLDLEDVR